MFKRFAEEVSDVLGYGGGITDEVLDTSRKSLALARLIGLEPTEHKASNHKFRLVVNTAAIACDVAPTGVAAFNKSKLDVLREIREMNAEQLGERVLRLEEDLAFALRTNNHTCTGRSCGKCEEEHRRLWP